ncbi:MAG: hypothetical protein QOF78_4574 [Phycisphaerales bacterium]|jgi:hypothetical protein|nr:hypothetical protein [Phycisphaerales bacterium]
MSAATTTQEILDELTPILQQIDDAADREYARWVDPANPLSKPTAELHDAASRANDAVPADLRDRAAALFPALCHAYLAESPEQRQQTRERVRDRQTLHHHLIGFVHFNANQIRNRKEDPSIALRRGLAAASIENNVLDFRDMYIALGELYKAAATAGVDPTPLFAEIAALSDEKSAYPESKQEPLNVFLRDFTRSAFFAVDVETNL